MNRHQSTLCTSPQCAFGGSNRFWMISVGADASAQPTRDALRMLRRGVVGLPRLVVAGASALVRPLARPLGIAAYIVLAIVAMALLLRVSGMPSFSVLSFAEMAMPASRSHETRSDELDGQAQDILTSLGGRTSSGDVAAD